MSITFTSKVFQKEYLMEGVTTVCAIMTIASSGAGAVSSSSAQGLVMGLVCDNSGSMAQNGGAKIRNGRKALIAAIELLRPTDEFFLIAGNSNADVVVELCLATDANKKAAIDLIKGEASKRVGGRDYRGFPADGGTEFSKWIRKMQSIFDTRPGKIHQALLLTDGDNQEDNSLLADALKEAEGHFQCECRGVEAGFKPEQLRTIAAKLLGTVDMIRDAANMTADFTAIMQKSTSLAVSNVEAQIWVPAGAKIVSFKDMTNNQLDLTGKGKQGANAQTFRYPTGAWSGEESRDYMITIELPKAGVPRGPKMLAGRAALILTENGTETKAGEAQILGVWTDDIVEGSRMEPKVDNYTGQAELTKVVQEGLALRATDPEAATKKLQRGRELAIETGNEGTRRLIDKIVDVVDEKEGTIRLKKTIDEADAVELDTRSSRTKRV